MKKRKNFDVFVRTGNGSKWSAYLDPEEESKRDKICSENEEHEDLEKEQFSDSYLAQEGCYCSLYFHSSRVYFTNIGFISMGLFIYI